MKYLVYLLFPFSIVALVNCYPGHSTSTSTEHRSLGDARNWVMIMHAEACGDSSEVASNMYVENNHDSSTITVVVDISWTENGQPRHENKTLTVGPNAKALIGCDHKNGVYLKMEIVSAVYR